MNKIIILLIFISYTFFSCEKNDSISNTSSITPILVTSPSINPSSQKSNVPININAKFTSDTIIDSIGISYILDSMNYGNDTNLLTLDSMYIYNDKKNIIDFSHLFNYPYLLKTGNSVRINIVMYYRNKSTNKWILIDIL